MSKTAYLPDSRICETLPEAEFIKCLECRFSFGSDTAPFCRLAPRPLDPLLGKQEFHYAESVRLFGKCGRDAKHFTPRG